MTHIPQVTFHWPYEQFDYVFDWPVGTEPERAVAFDNLPIHWTNTNPHARLYEIAEDVWNWHSGVDLNLNFPSHNLDFNHVVKSIGNGLVLYMGDGRGTWGNIIDIFYPLRDSFVVARFGHISWLFPTDGYKQPQMNDYVRVGQPICKIGNIKDHYGKTYAHLHWDMSAPGSDVLIERPNQWCGTNKECVLTQYIDPIKFIIQMKKARPLPPPPPPEPEPEEIPVTPTQYYVKNTSVGFTKLNIRQWHSATSTILSELENGTPIIGYDQLRRWGGYTWRLVEIMYRGEKVSGWCVADKLTTTPPTTPP